MPYQTLYSTSTQRALTLIANDGGLVTVDENLARNSVLLQNLIDDLGIPNEPVPVPNVNAHILSLAFTYCGLIRNGPPRGNSLSQVPIATTPIIIPPEEFEFLTSLSKDELFLLMRAANYLDLSRLSQVIPDFIAQTFIKGKSVQEIRDAFNLTDDLTPADREEIRRDDEWRECEGGFSPPISDRPPTVDPPLVG